tara:strand:+ start:511 stop:1029 length:519 start_codon:yes stop_codon:yes gene_type:complete
MLEQKLEKLINNYPDFPKKGIMFKDISPILANPEIFSEVIDRMSSYSINQNADALIAVDARGFLFATAIGLKLSKPVILARKPGKLPGELLQKKYDLEYGSNLLSLQKSSLEIGKEFVIIDDLLATGGTVNCIKEILLNAEKIISGLIVVVELLDLNARSKLDFPIESVIKY